jgi:hypothetical protein
MSRDKVDFVGTVNGIDVIAVPGQPVRCLAFVNQSSEKYIQVTTELHTFQTVLELASLMKAKVEVSYDEHNQEKILTRVTLKDRSVENETKPTPMEIKKEAERQQKEGVPIELNVPLTTMQICAGSPIPNGWIKTDDSWSPTSCGNPTDIIYNVWTITQYSNLPVGSTLNVCAGAPIPTGWVKVNTSWNPTSCGHPAHNIDNVQTIRRVK